MVTLGVFRGDWFRRSEIKLELRNGVNFAQVNPENHHYCSIPDGIELFSSTKSIL